MSGGDFPEFFAALAAAAAALTGLLFVAVSVGSRGDPDKSPAPVVSQVRAAAALIAFVNTLAVSLFGLVPGNTLGWPAMVLGIIGLLFTAAGVRSAIGSGSGAAKLQLGARQAELTVLLLLIFGTELATGIMLLANPNLKSAAELLGDALVASLLMGIARAWELVGDRDTGIVASISVLLGRTPSPLRTATHPAAEPARQQDSQQPASAEPDDSTGPAAGGGSAGSD
jgi:hypothetical protein